MASSCLMKRGCQAFPSSACWAEPIIPGACPTDNYTGQYSGHLKGEDGTYNKERMKLSSVLGGERRHQGPPERHAILNYLQDERMGHKVLGRGREACTGQHLCMCGWDKTTEAGGQGRESCVPSLSAFKALPRMHTMKAR